MASNTIKLNWRKSETHGLLADPQPRPIKYTLISVDDHAMGVTGENRRPARLYRLFRGVKKIFGFVSFSSI